MHEPERAEQLSGIGDRVFAGILGAGAMVATTILGPVAIVMLWKGVGAKYFVFALFSDPAQYLIGIAVFAVVGAVAGVVLGSRRVISVFGYLWFTERPVRPLVTASLWAALAILWAVTYETVLHAI
jgi:hypothetical protein